LNRHISRHFAEKKHKCRDCDMAFIDKRDYIVHVSKVLKKYLCSKMGCLALGVSVAFLKQPALPGVAPHTKKNSKTILKNKNH
jgi:hypothetical protein